MTWLFTPEECVRGLDLSANQETMDIDKVIDLNPDIVVWTLRAENAFGRQDAKFPYFYDRLVARGKEPDVYLWPDPFKPIDQVKARWEAALRGREPHNVLVGDFEFSAAKWTQWVGKTPIRSITDDTWATIDMAKTMTSADVMGYASGHFWDSNIRVHGREKDTLFWTPHYPTWWRDANGDWRQARNFAELEAHLPIKPDDLRGRGWYFPNVGEHIPVKQVKGWQFSDHGWVAGYNRHVDLSLWERAYINPPPAPPTVEERLDDHERRIVALEG